MSTDQGSALEAGEPISVRQVEATRLEVAGFDEDRIREHGKRFLEEQPELTRFLTTLTRDLAGPSAEFTFYVGCILWTMFHRAYGRKLPAVRQDLLVRKFQLLRGDMERFVGAESRFLERYLRHAEFMRQPHLVRYLVDALLEDRREWRALGREARGVCLVVLLSAILAMDDAREPRP